MPESSSWRILPRLTLLLALLGCGSTGSSSDGHGSSAGGAGPSSGPAFALPETCSEFGFEVQLGCEECPAVAPTCGCLDELDGLVQLLPDQACTSGKCLTAVDCERLCENFDAAFGPEWSEDAVAVQACVRALGSCNDDAECGTGQLCILWGGPVDGYRGGCAERGSVCNDAADCLQGSRCIVFEMKSDSETGAVIPYGVCSTGEDNTACIVDDDCVAPNRCVSQNLDTFVSSQCSTGENGEPCVADDDCISPYQCIVVSAGGFAQCSAGGLGDPCSEPSDCQSGACSAENPGQSGTCISL